MSDELAFEPLDEGLFAGIKGTHSIAKRITANSGGNPPDWTEADLAIIGVGAANGSPNNLGCKFAPNAFRNSFYRLKKGNGDYKIVDLGNLVLTDSISENHNRLQRITEAMLTAGVVPILIGGSHDLTYPQFKAYEKLGRKVTIANIDAGFDLNANATEGENKHHLFKIFSHQPDFIFNYNHLAYQSYLADNSVMNGLGQLYYNLVRLGKLRESINEVEPYLREADMLSFDISAIRMSDAPANANALPFGLTGEEACQLSWFAGTSNKLTSVGFYEFNPELDIRNQTAQTLAVIVWYFIEGFYSRKFDADFTSANYLKYIVPFDSHPHNLVFYKSTLSDLWWVEVPALLDGYAPDNKVYAPCSYRDYIRATEGHIPDRWLNTHAKLL